MTLSDSIHAPPPKKRLIIIADTWICQETERRLNDTATNEAVKVLFFKSNNHAGTSPSFDLYHYLQYDTHASERLKGNCAIDEFVQDVR